jgi:hypothetical protein
MQSSKSGSFLPSTTPTNIGWNFAQLYILAAVLVSYWVVVEDELLVRRPSVNHVMYECGKKNSSMDLI